MKRILSILAIIIFVTVGAFAADDLTQDSTINQIAEFELEPPVKEQIEVPFTEQTEETILAPELVDDALEETSEVKVAENSDIPSNVNAKIYIDNYFSMNALFGFTLPPFVDTDLYIASGLKFDFYKYYGYKNYGMYLKLAVLGENYKYGSYEIVFGGTYRYIPFDMLELFGNLGPSITYYNDMLETSSTDDATNLLYVGAEVNLGLRFYPFKENNLFALNIGVTGTYMLNIPFSSNADTVMASRYSVMGFVGYTYAFRGKPKEQQPNE